MPPEAPQPKAYCAIQTAAVHPIKTHFPQAQGRRQNLKLLTNFIFSKFHFEKRSVKETNWKKYCTAGQPEDDNMAHAHCILYT
jgi:hypothetical protein